MVGNGPLVVFGSIVQDLISYTDRFPRPGESVRGHHFLAGSGGKGANQAVAAAKLGTKVSMIGRIGNDMFGDKNLEGLKKEGICVEGIEKSNSVQTATATITVNKEGENSIVVTLGANMELDDKAAERNEEIISKAGLLLCQAEIPDSGNKRAFELAKKHGVTVFFNPAPGDPNLDKNLLKLVDIVCVNENEAEFITGHPLNSVEDAKKQALEICKFGPKSTIITLGAKGVVISENSTDPKHVEVSRVEAIDTTGAGDCFCGSLAYFLLAGKSLEESTQKAAQVAALSVTRKGTQASYWSSNEIREKYPELLG
ncbi:hypothetical protein WR25_14152 [Diploscapter pachys]|uniref:Ribokinase n=1 Tax=Diploscapter pachys TaxID=2018661 RepID=A0A2A2LSL2_9BILA|nr:hypothetical protein WR25_14152 [Diploscapter pachys]